MNEDQERKEWRARVEKDLADIKTALCGDGYGNQGIVPRISTLERWQASVDRRVWMALGAGSVIVFLIQIIKFK